MRRKFNFVGRRKLWYLLSLLIIIPGMISFSVQGLNTGIDFTGGNIFRLQFEQQVDTGQLREVMGAENMKDFSLQQSGERQFIIRTPELAEEDSKQLLRDLEQKLGKLEVLGNDKVGAVIGAELRKNAIMALVIASILMVIYITIRFEFFFAIAAITALLHDVMVTVSIFSLFRIQVDSAFVAAILTIIGYSINDTIVIFDRIRENLKLHRKESLEELVNNSISQTLTRSINTVLTVVMALLALIFLGGETTRVFALAMLVGTLSGTYSSIFTASPLWIDLRGWRKRQYSAQRARA
ncbi:preprotein translocase subunit SecF [Clostridiales bacterium PH28_bin88]|nr:preprotein translocase subunit SecF [Clostridiales bacterium PH28_bin88]